MIFKKCHTDLSASVALRSVMKVPTGTVSKMETWMKLLFENTGEKRFLRTLIRTVAVALRDGNPPSLATTLAT